jgi:hypothetical protein
MPNFPLNLLTFPWWWYSVGWSLVKTWTKREYFFGLHKTGLLIFARHLNEPLYGDYTKSGVVFSFFLRIFILIYKLLAFALRLIFVALADLLYLLFLPALLVIIIFQLLGLKHNL